MDTTTLPEEKKLSSFRPPGEEDYTVQSKACPPLSVALQHTGTQILRTNSAYEEHSNSTNFA